MAHTMSTNAEERGFQVHGERHGLMANAMSSKIMPIDFSCFLGGAHDCHAMESAMENAMVNSMSADSWYFLHFISFSSRFLARMLLPGKYLKQTPYTNITK